MPNIKFAFFGTPEIAVDTLDILKNSGFTPSVIITARDMPRGRKLTITPPPVKVWAENNNIPVFQPDKLEQDFSGVADQYAQAWYFKYPLLFIAKISWRLPCPISHTKWRQNNWRDYPANAKQIRRRANYCPRGSCY